MMKFNTQKKDIKEAILDQGEALSAVSFVKRKFRPEGQKEEFPSVAEIALLKSIEELKNKDCLDAYKELCGGKNGFINQCLKRETSIKFNGEDLGDLNDNFDYQLIYPENVTGKNFPLEKQREIAQEIVEKLESHLKDKHYAMIMFDGDKMGEWLSGENTLHNNQTLEGFHTDLSSFLSVYAKSVENILKNKGKVIYAGGDDFLGMINLHYLFEVMRELRKKFDEAVNNRISLKQQNKNLTFSAGIVIAHYKTPLSEVLKKVREMEKKAKNIGGRNAFALSVIKHSGEVQEAILKWDAEAEEPKNCSNWDEIEIVFEKLNSETFSNKYITNLTTELYALAGVGLEDLDVVSEKSIELEINRLVSRALIKRISKEADKGEIKNLSEAVKHLFQNAAPKNKIQNFIHALHIADFMQRKLQKFKPKGDAN